MTRPPHVAVVGGGWAGLAAAVELVSAGARVTLLESAPQLGGRARRVEMGGLALDNGQHLLIGAYRETRRLMRRVGADEKRLLLRRRLRLRVLDGERTVDVASGPLPAPFHLAWGLWRARGLDDTERRAALDFALAMRQGAFSLHRDISVLELLTGHNQPASLITVLWEPICIAALNTPPAYASARLFLRVLQESFCHHRGDADLLLPRRDLSALFPEPARRFIETHGGRVITGCKVAAIRVTDGRTSGVTCGDEPLDADHVVLAVPPRRASQLLTPLSGLAPVTERIDALHYEPVTTVYLRYPRTVRLEPPMQGATGGLAQWLFDRCVLYGQPGLLAAVISGSGAHQSMGHDELIGAVISEVGRHFPDWPEPEESLMIRERHATFSSRVGVDLLRPGSATPQAGLWLAGDYTATGLPATLEGAVRSGVECAQQILAPLSH